MTISTYLEEMYCVFTYKSGSKVWVSGVYPISETPHLLDKCGIDVAIAVIEEISLPYEFKRALSQRIKHHHFCIYNCKDPRDHLFTQLKSIWRAMYNAVDRDRDILIYSRDPCALTTILIGFLIYLYSDNGFVTCPFIKTHNNWSLSLLKYLEKLYPQAEIKAEQMRWLVQYELSVLELWERPFQVVATFADFVN